MVFLGRISLLASLGLLSSSVGCEGKIKLLIGQTYRKEYDDYVAGFNSVPAGSSHYADLYHGRINQGDDAFNDYLGYIARTQPGATVMMAISLKDNVHAGGYSGPSGTYAAVRDVAYETKWDDNLRKIGKQMAKYPKLTFLVRLEYEVSMYAMANAANMLFTEVLDIYNKQGVNIYGFTTRQDFEKKVDSNHIDLESYVLAFRKMARILKGEGSNMKMVYHPVRALGETRLLYPGDKHVDYIAFSCFNHDLAMATDESNPYVRELGLDGARVDAGLESSLKWATARKPVVIAEAAFQSVPSGWLSKLNNPQGQTAIEDYLDRLFDVAERFQVFALTYINSDWKSHGWKAPWTDSRVEVNAKGFWKKRVIDSGKYQMGSRDGGVSTPSLPPPPPPPPAGVDPRCPSSAYPYWRCGRCFRDREQAMSASC